MEALLRGMLAALTVLMLAVLWTGPQGPPRVVDIEVVTRPTLETPATGSGIPAEPAAEPVSDAPPESPQIVQEAPGAILPAAVAPDTRPPVVADSGPPASMRSDIPNSAWSPPIIGPQASKPLLMNGTVIPGAYQCWDQHGYTTNWTEPVCWPGTAGRPPEHPVPTALTPYLP